MALIFEGKMPEPQPLNLDGYQPGWGRYLSAAYGQAWDFNPVPTINRNLDLLKAEGAPGDIFDMSGQELADYARDWRKNPMPGVMSQAEQEAYIEDNGLKGQIRWNPQYTKEALDIIIENRKLDNERKLIMENGSAGQTAAGLGLGFIAGAFDPLNIASVLVPVAGEARLASMMLDSGENVFRRMGIRALQGASAGLSGSLMVEPLIAGGQTLMQSDYSMTQSLLNLTGGAVLGGALRAGFGALGDWRRARKGLPQPWEYVPPDDDSRALMDARAGEIEESFREANPDGYTPEEIREMARAGAGLYDAAARRWAYMEKKTVGEFYELNDVAFQSWKDFVPEGWRDVLPEGWRKRGSEIGDALRDMSWIGREYDGLRELNADALELPDFMELMGEWERRFPDMEDFAGIRARIEDLQKRGVGKQFEDALNQLAWHGSPHRFNKFSLKKIGSGEGAQVHGWGIYFAQSRETANGYRVRLGGSGYTYKGKPLHELFSELESRGDYDRLGVLEGFMTSHDPDKMDFSLYDSKAAEWFKKEIHPKLKGDGKLYEVDIPESAVLLDEQKTLAEQPKEVKEALAKAADAMPDDEAWADMSEYLYSALEENRATGRDLYNALAILGTKDYDQTLRISTKGARSASEFLNNFGVKGITYVGQEDGRCFVIFDDKAINVTNRLYHSEERAKAGQFGIDGAALAENRTLSERFAELPFIEANPKKFFGNESGVSEDGWISRKKLVEWARKIFNKSAAFKNKDTGFDIIVSVRSIKNTVNHGLNEAKAYSVPFIPDLIKSGIYIDTFNKNDKLKSHIFANKINIDGKKYATGFVVREDMNGKRFYDHELTEIIDPDLLQHAYGPQSGSDRYVATAANQGHVINILREKLGVKSGASNILFQTSPALRGRQTRILGSNTRDDARYEVWELDNVIASHDPENQFRRNDKYPAIAQERPYHSDKSEQDKVIVNSRDYEPERVISDDASSDNGPPIITRKGVALGGNSRLMTLQLVYGQRPESAAAYRRTLKAKAGQFGIDGAAIDKMKKPALVRVVEGDLTPEQMARKSREYNQPSGQALQAEAEGISRARFINEEVLGALAEGLENGDVSVGEFLAGKNSGKFAQLLLDAGVLRENEIGSLTTVINGVSKLNESGKARVTLILRGLALPDYDLMTSLPKKTLDNLDAAISGLALSRARGGGWDLTGAFYEAMRFAAEAKLEKTSVENVFFQHMLTPDMDPMRENPVVQALTLIFSNSDPREIQTRMERYTKLSKLDKANQNSFFPEQEMTPEKAFREAFLSDMAFAGKEVSLNFNPKSNPRDAAILWAVENGGKKPTAERVLAKLDKRLAGKKITPEERAGLKEIRQELIKLDGAISIRKPKVGTRWRDQGKLEIPGPKQPGERGALPEAARISENEADLNDPDALLPPELREDAPEGPGDGRIYKGQVEFDPETGAAVITFFQAADLSTASHELFHVFRRQIERAANMADASPWAKEQWRKVCDFAGAREGQAWTAEMEEKFANAGLRYLASGAAPTPALQGVFDRMKQWFMDIYQRADNIGVEISPQMRKALNEMFTVPYDAADRDFRYAVADIHTREAERDFANPDSIGERLSPEDQAVLDAEKRGNLDALEQFANDAEARANELTARLERDNPELAERLADPETRAEIENGRLELERAERRDELRRDALECVANGG